MFGKIEFLIEFLKEVVSNSILTLKVGDGWIKRVSKIQSEVVIIVLKYFKEPHADRPYLVKVVFCSLFDKDNFSFSTSFLLPGLNFDNDSL